MGLACRGLSSPSNPGKWKEGARIARASARARTAWKLGGSRLSPPASLKEGRASCGRQPAPAPPGSSVGLVGTPQHP